MAIAPQQSIAKYPPRQIVRICLMQEKLLLPGPFCEGVELRVGKVDVRVAQESSLALLAGSGLVATSRLLLLVRIQQCACLDAISKLADCNTSK